MTASPSTTTPVPARRVSGACCPNRAVAFPGRRERSSIKCGGLGRPPRGGEVELDNRPSGPAAQRREWDLTRGGSGDPPREIAKCRCRVGLATLACCIGLAALAAGCRTAAPAVRRPSVEADACAERLHDLSGRLLLHYSLHRRLPETLEALAALDPEQPVPLVCPVSGEPYVYRPKGLQVPGHPGRLVLYDAVACHSAMRWGVFVDDAGDARRLTARVILIPDELVPSATAP